MQTIIFEDQGQDFLEWIIHNGVVVDCQPSQSFVWVGREVMVKDDIAYIRDGENGVPMNYKVESCTDTNPAYVAGFNDAQADKKNSDRYNAEVQYKYGFNVGQNFKKHQK